MTGVSIEKGLTRLTKMFLNLVQKKSFAGNMVRNEFDADFIYLDSFLTTKIHFFLKKKKKNMK